MNSTFAGSCLCEAVKYTVSGDPKHSVLCHCDSCQKVSGSTFMANYLYDKNQLQVSRGQESITTYEDRATASGQSLKRCFCGVCGSNLFVYSDLPQARNMISVTSGTLDDSVNLRPQLEFFCRNRRNWLPADGVPGAEQKQTQ
ncbi:Mss4-like protein [Aspergillus floccosus]